MSRAVAGGVLLIAVACGPAGRATIERGCVHSNAATQPETPAVAPAVKAWLASFPGCDSPDGACHCDDRVLAVPHRELDRGPMPNPTSGQLVIVEFDLHPLKVTYFAPVLLHPPGICLSGPCPTEGPVRFELVGPGGRTTRRHGTWSCRAGDERGYCRGPIMIWRGTSMSDAWLDIAPDDETLRLFVSDRLVYSIQRSKLPMSARVVLLAQPEYALAVSFGDGEPEGSFVSLSLEASMVDFPGTSLEVRRRSKGCWTLIELGDLPFVDPVGVRLSDAFRSEIYELPLQDGVPRAAGPKAPAPPFVRANLARHTFQYGELLEAADFSWADLRKAHFRSVSARGARLHEARLQQAYIHLSDFASADFSQADLDGAYLIGVKLRHADFRGANLARARLDRSDLRGANLEGARNLTQAQLDDACGDSLTTKLPPGLRITTCMDIDESERPASPTGNAELLVATSSAECTTKQCPGQCCNTCGRVQWKLASDSKVVAQGFMLPDPVANECGLHYDLRADGERKGDGFEVRAVRPVPSERGRRSGTRGQLELRAKLGTCTVMGCSLEDPCCNHCSFEGWRPKPTLDVVTWSGAALPVADSRACDQGFDLAVTGTWRGPSAFEVTSVRMLRW